MTEKNTFSVTEQKLCFTVTGRSVLLFTAQASKYVLIDSLIYYVSLSLLCRKTETCCIKLKLFFSY